MKISKYLKLLVKDFFTTSGFLIVITAIFLNLYLVETIKSSLLWQIILLSLAYTFFKFAFVNKYDFGKKVQMINFTIFSVLADLTVLLWLWLFSPSKIVDINLMIIYTIVILLVKGMVYVMMYIDGNKQAKQLNEKLSEYKNEN